MPKQQISFGSFNCRKSAQELNILNLFFLQKRDFDMKVIDINLFLKFLADISPFVGPLILLFWTSGDISSGFQSQNGQSYLHLVEVHMIYVP